MTELVPDPSPTRPTRVKWLLLLLLLILAVAFAYYMGQRSSTQPSVSGAIESAPVEVTAAPSAATPPAEPIQTVTPSPPPAVPAPEPVPPPLPVSAEEPPPPAPAIPDLAAAEEARKAGRLQEAREKAQTVLEQNPGSAEAEHLLGAIHTELIFSPRPMPEKADYIVQPGDSLDRIARQYGTTVELIQKGNNLRGALIKSGDRLRVFSGAWAIRVNKTRNDLVLTMNGKFFKRYRVGTGEYSKTPVGEFHIVDRLAQPTWWHPDGRTIPFGDPENLLGTHWLALDIKGYGIHGTWEPETVGKQSSLGCVRLANPDIEELFTLVTIGTPVIIEE